MLLAISTDSFPYLLFIFSASAAQLLQFALPVANPLLRLQALQFFSLYGQGSFSRVRCMGRTVHVILGLFILVVLSFLLVYNEASNFQGSCLAQESAQGPDTCTDPASALHRHQARRSGSSPQSGFNSELASQQVQPAKDSFTNPRQPARPNGDSQVVLDVQSVCLQEVQLLQSVREQGGYLLCAGPGQRTVEGARLAGRSILGSGASARPRETSIAKRETHSVPARPCQRQGQRQAGRQGQRRWQIQGWEAAAANGNATTSGTGCQGLAGPTTATSTPCADLRCNARRSTLGSTEQAGCAGGSFEELIGQPSTRSGRDSGCSDRDSDLGPLQSHAQGREPEDQGDQGNSPCKGCTENLPRCLGQIHSQFDLYLGGADQAAGRSSRRVCQMRAALATTACGIHYGTGQTTSDSDAEMDPKQERISAADKDPWIDFAEEQRVQQVKLLEALRQTKEQAEQATSPKRERTPRRQKPEGSLPTETAAAAKAEAVDPGKAPT